MLSWSLKRQEDSKPFLWCLVGLVIAVIGLVSSHYPYLMPGTMTLHAAASSTKTLEFMLIAVGCLLPLMLGYNAYQYYVFVDEPVPSIAQAIRKSRLYLKLICLPI